MSKSEFEQLKTKLEADRTETFQRKLADLLDEMTSLKRADDFILQALAGQ